MGALGLAGCCATAQKKRDDFTETREQGLADAKCVQKIGPECSAICNNAIASVTIKKPSTCIQNHVQGSDHSRSRSLEPAKQQNFKPLRPY